MRAIKIRWACSHYIANVYDGVRVRFDVVEATGMPMKIFGYLGQPMRPSTGERAHAFDHVCSPPDLAEYPEDEPYPNVRPDWLRLSYVDVLVRSLDEAHDFIEAVREDVRRLKATLDTMDTLVPGDEEWVDADPTAPSSESSTSSDSSGASGESDSSESA